MFELLINPKFKNSVPLYFKCLMDSFELTTKNYSSNRESNKDINTKKTMDDGNTTPSRNRDRFNMLSGMLNKSSGKTSAIDRKKKRNTITSTPKFSTKNQIFMKLNKLIDLKKFSTHIMKLMQFGNHPQTLKTEISKTNF